MTSTAFPGSDQVLGDLGAPFVSCFLASIEGARQDLDELRSFRPSWVPGFTSRFTANFLHERIWDRLVRLMGSAEGFHIYDREPVREISCGTKYHIRLKRHHPGDRISAYPTEGSRAFWSNTSVALEGLECYSLAIGYMWDQEIRAMGEAVLSFRDGKDNPVWAIRLDLDETTATGFTYDSVVPTVPEIDTSRIASEAVEEDGS